MSLIRSSVLLSLICGLVSACAVEEGRDFSRFDATTMLGTNLDEQQVIAKEGTPTQWKTIGGPTNKSDPTLARLAPASNIRVWSELRYEYMSQSLGNDIGLKVGVFSFADHRLCGWSFNSDVPTVTTQFDLDQARTIVRGMDRSAVLARLGTPTGKAVYPCVAQPGDSEDKYIYQHVTRSRNIARHLHVLYDRSGHVVDLSLESMDRPL